LKLAPNDARLLHARGVTLWDTGKTADARKDLEAAVKADPKNGRYQLTLGELYYQLKMLKQSGLALFAATEVRPNDVDAWRAYGRVCTSLKDYDQAADAYERVV